MVTIERAWAITGEVENKRKMVKPRAAVKSGLTNEGES